MNTIFRQPSIREQHTLGGSVYSQRQAAGEYQKVFFDAGVWIAHGLFKSRGHFAPVVSEEVLENRHPTMTPPDVYIRKRVLPVIKATGRIITQAEIDDALDD